MHLLPAKGRYIPLGIEFLKKNFPVVLPTDTLYGICADALTPEAVEKVYHAKWRNPSKPLIVLVYSPFQIEEFFGIKPTKEVLNILNYKKPISLLLPVKGFEWVSRGSGLIAFRWVKEGFIKKFLQTYKRPLVAPSANWEGFPPAKDIFQAFFYFGNWVSVYYDGGVLKGLPSALLKLEGKKAKILRRGNLNEEDFKNLKVEPLEEK
ncbi:MAG TPA: Sua5/YciO/YrdC/YwlC family protein [Aquifex aeolicus]|nr:Sua5/YciO/YrdC/YwlC family protein [Aquificales bacterium]HIQ25950.1 Sua5/YciO/YrdC/YwlC family protein [Aquifex aeolicus]